MSQKSQNPKILDYLKVLFSKSDTASLKRWLGFLGFVEVMILVIFYPEYISELLYVSAGLIGLTVLDKWSPGNKKDKEDKPNKTIEEAENES